MTGVFGTGKTSVVAEIADVWEKRGETYAALDLDWLGWFDLGSGDDHAVSPLLVMNLLAVVDNYLAAGIRSFAMARSIGTRAELESLRDALPMPLSVVRLTVPIETIEERLRSDVTAGRQDDLREARVWTREDTGAGLEDFVVPNDRPIREVALAVVDRLGWN